MEWFTVDKAGLAKLLARKGKAFAIFELIQNAWDEDTKSVEVKLDRIPGTRSVRLTVDDDNPEGFVDLSHAFTLFAESTKKNDAAKRGRFNLGEKLVLALCEEAEIISTKGTIQFDSTGRHARRSKRERGSMFTGVLRMTNEEMAECGAAIQHLIPPSGIVTIYNGEPIPARSPIKLRVVTLPTETADEEGYLRKSSRKTGVEIYEPLPGETGTLYEMGIPVVETGDRYHVNVMQKVPLNLDRDNVSPSYLSQIRAIVVEATQDRLTLADANSTWVKNAVEEHGDELPDEAITKLVDLRFGEKRVIYDPSDPEANKLAVTQGYTVVYGNQLSGAEWNVVRRSGAMLPAGQVTPSPKPFHPDGKPLKVLDQDKWTPGIRHVVAYTKRIAPKLIGIPVSVKIANDAMWPFAAVYGKGGSLILNLGRLGHKWFSETLANRTDVNDLLIHEFGHEYSGDHLSSSYHDALTRLGAKMTELALSDPTLFK